MRLALVVAVACLTAVGICAGQDATASIRKFTNIPAQDLVPALKTLAYERGFQLVFRSEVVGAKHTQGAVGKLTATEALARLLEGTNLMYSYLNDKTVMIVPVNSNNKTNGQSSSGGSSQHCSGPLNQNESEGALDCAESFSPENQVPATRIASAQDAAVKDSAGKSDLTDESTSAPQLAEIVVTAQKREQRLQDVPLSISTISSQDIDRRGLVGMGDYLSATPGVTMQDRGAGRSSIIIRGVTVDQEFEASSSGGSAVGIYFGDTPLAGYSTLSNADIKLVDMERVEVLRGPQGTLYGSSALAGAVRNIPNPPDLKDFEGNIKTGYSDTAGSNNYLIQGVVNAPIVSETLAVRVVAYRHKNGGYVDNVAGEDPQSIAVATGAGLPGMARNQQNVGGSEFNGGRVSVLWKPTSTFNAQLTYMKQTLEQDGFPEVQLNLPGRYEQARLDLSNFVSGGERLEHQIDLSNLVLRKDFSLGALQSSSSWTGIHYVQNQDGRQAFPAGTLLGDLPIPQVNLEKNHFFTQEVRFVSSLQGPIQFVTGTYYENVNLFRVQDSFVGTTPALNPFASPDLLLFSLKTHQKQVAFFGETTYSWRHLLSLTVGARHFDYNRDDVETRGGLFGGGGGPESIDEQGKTYKVNLSFTPDPNTHIYAQWAEGFRIGRGGFAVPAALCDKDGDGVIDGTNVTVAQTARVKSDTLDNYEFGWKFVWPGNRLKTDLSIFSTKWNGLPQSFVAPCGLSVLINSGDARIRGADLDGTLLLTDSLHVNFGASYKHGTLTKVLEGVPAKVGDRLPGSADFNFSAGVQYDFHFPGYAAFVRGDYYYVGGYYDNLQQTGVESGNYHMGNIRLGLSKGRLDFGAFVDNVANEDKTVFTSSVFIQDQRAVRLRPRTFGVDMQFNF